MIRFFKLLRFAGHDLRLLWLALRHPSRPAWLLPVTVVLGLYALDPANLALPALGVVDDFVLLPLAVHLLLKLLPAAIRAELAGARRAR
jgi:uncharacterized membrane protein YkvA (DUF1232 family)